MKRKQIPMPGNVADVSEMVVDLDQQDESRSPLVQIGGQTLLRVVVFETRAGVRKRAVVHLSARISGDTRAGATHGLHLSMEYARSGSDVTKRLHVSPWVPVDKKGEVIR